MASTTNLTNTTNTTNTTITGPDPDPDPDPDGACQDPAQGSTGNADDHPFVATIKRYYLGCNTADEALMLSTFTADVVHYFVDHAPVSGAASLARYWAKVGPKTAAHWLVDHAIVAGDEAVIEWSMRWLPPGASEPELLRGTEWFLFRDQRIAEVRSYHCNHYLAAPENRALRGFPHAERGYRSEP